MKASRGALWPLVSLLVVAAALVLLIIEQLAMAPKVGAASDYIVVAPMELTVGEPAGQDIFTITLVIVPTDTVTIALSTSDTTECVVEPPSLEFTPENYEAVVTVAARNDDIDDGDRLCIVETAFAVSDDPIYSGEDADDVIVTVTDDDVTGFAFEPSTPLTVSEPNGQATFTMSLTSEPTATVSMGLTVESTECSVEPGRFSFTPENWQTGITATVTALDDDIVDGPQSCQVAIGRTQSDDPLYDHLLPAPVQVIVLDDDGLEDTSIGDYVWYDEDSDGLQDETESGIAGVTVFLDLDENGALDDGEPFTTTNALGIYAFANLAAGEYLVQIVDDAVLDGYDLTTGNLPLTVNLAESQHYDQADFGYDDDPEDAAIGDYVWFDQDGGGDQDETESGLPGVTVYLDLNENGILDGGEPSATTGENGIYSITGLAAGDYLIQVDPGTVPAGYELTTGNLPLPVTLLESEVYAGADFGYDGDARDAAIGDYVWLDQDGDAEQDGTESGLEGITVFVDLNGSADLDPGEPFATTAADGIYTITGLAAGDYLIQVDPDTVPAGYDLTTDNLPFFVSLDESEVYNGADFGYDDDAEDASVGDYVWFDRDGDAVQDPDEDGLPGVTVYLDLDADASIDPGEPYAETNGYGEYQITGLAAGEYLVRVHPATIPAGYELTTANLPFPVILGESGLVDDADFGYDDDAEDASIGDYVWFDRDGDSVQDAIEPGLSGVTIFLDLNRNGILDLDEPSAITDDYGQYRITGLSAGTYLVRLDPAAIPVGYELTTGNLPLSVNLAEGQYYAGADFGYEGYALTLSVTGEGSVPVDPDFATYMLNTAVTLSPTADPGWTFDGWTGPDAAFVTDNEDGTWSLLIDGDKEVTAVFTQDEYLLTVNVDGSGWVEIDPELPTYHYGDRVNLSAHADPGWTFSSWSGDLVSTSNPVVMTIHGSAIITATFTQDEYAVNIAVSGNGSVSKEPDQATYHYGDEVTLQAIPDPGWRFVGWSGDLSGTANPATLTVLRDMSVVAVLAQVDYTLTVNTIGNGSVSKDPNQTIYHYGDEVTLQAIPDPGWGFAGWTGDLEGTANPAVLIMDGHKTITAVFEWQHNLTVNTEGAGSVLLDPDGGIYAHDSVVQLTAIPSSGWTFSGWSGDLSGTDNLALLTIDRDLTVTASFVYRLHLPLLLRSWPPPPTTPTLDPIENADGNGSYTVSWSAISGAEAYVLQEATNSAFSNAAVVYTGPSTSYAVSGRGAARYYYRVKSITGSMESEWSTVRQVDVLWEAEINDTYTQANGAIVPTLVYYGTFPNAGDVSDYYFFDLSAAYRVEIWLMNIPAGQNYNLVLRDASLTEIGYSAQPGNTDEHISTSQDLPPGRYYIQVYHFSSGGSTQPYQIVYTLD